MKYKLIISVIVAVCIIISISALYQYYAPPKHISPYQLNKGMDTIHIAFIGDSWAHMHRDHNCKIAKLIEDTLHKPTTIHSYGVCGLTSKEIYENIFENNDFKHFLQKRAYKYCIISAGINDCNKKMGIKNYKTSMDYIIEFFLHNQIRPIILEIPDYDIYKAYKDMSPSRKIIRSISMKITNTPLDCKQMFREALNEVINKNEYTNKVSIIRFQLWNSNGEKDIKTMYIDDGLHLNEYGYSVLDSVIAKEILLVNNDK